MVGTSLVEETAIPTIGARLRERRRPRRTDYGSPALVALLRDTSIPAAEPEPRDAANGSEKVDLLGPARGIVASAVIGGLAWAIIAGCIWLLILLRG